MTSSFVGLPGVAGALAPLEVVDSWGDRNQSIRMGERFSVRAAWHIESRCAARALDGTWIVRLYAEPAGPGPGVQLGQGTVQATGEHTYAACIDIDTTEVGLAVGADRDDSSVYKLVAILSYRNSLQTNLGIVGVEEGPYFEVMPADRAIR